MIGTLRTYRRATGRRFGRLGPLASLAGTARQPGWDGSLPWLAMSHPTLAIRAVPYDLPAAGRMTEALQAYYRSLYNGPDRSPVDPAEFAPPRGRFFVGYEDDVPVAMGGWRWIDALPQLPARRPVEIKRMYVSPQARGRGHARAMLAHLEVTARDAGADAVVLSTGQPQQEAIALYRSAGYGDIARFGYYARYDTAVHLGKRLPAGQAAGQGSAVAAGEPSVIAPPVGGTGR
jgi:ribosomal protein S18 acetylase RimI-like enzyme